ncbi:sporulation protein [Bacillus haynesii]|uniref:Sporulation protein n=1 Tax=Bacillus haynesii TaxID=1925021 RepID=A0ABX3I4S4_9BACI|nr:sporulation protein [Bacillus haynesii]
MIFYFLQFFIIVSIIYIKFKRSVGFQPLKPARMLFRIFLFSGIFVFLLTMSALHPLSYFYDLIGIALGFILTAYALKHVSIENRGGVLYFRTHLWIELIVLLLFLYRFLYRIAEIGQLQTAVSDGGSAAYGALFTQDPATMIGFFVLAVYYVGFSFFVLKKGRSEEKRSA